MQGLYKGIASTIGSSKKKTDSHNYSSEWKSLLPGLSKIKGSLSPALGHFFPPVGHLPPLKEKKATGQEEKGMTEDEMAGWHH